MNEMKKIIDLMSKEIDREEYKVLLLEILYLLLSSDEFTKYVQEKK